MCLGFIDYGEGSLDQKFVALREQCVKQRFDYTKVATHMLTLMVRGIFLSVIFHWHSFLLKVSINIPIGKSYVDSYNSGVSSEPLIYIVWRAIRMLALIGLQVISIVADGASNTIVNSFGCIKYPGFNVQVLHTRLRILPSPAVLCISLPIHHT